MHKNKDGLASYKEKDVILSDSASIKKNSFRQSHGSQTEQTCVLEIV